MVHFGKINKFHFFGGIPKCFIQPCAVMSLLFLSAKIYKNEFLCSTSVTVPVIPVEDLASTAPSCPAKWGSFYALFSFTSILLWHAPLCIDYAFVIRALQVYISQILVASALGSIVEVVGSVRVIPVVASGGSLLGFLTACFLVIYPSNSG